MAGARKKVTKADAAALPKLGERGDALQPIQRQLNSHGARIPIDGRFSASMRRAIERFQYEHGLDSTGALDKATLDALA